MKPDSAHRGESVDRALVRRIDALPDEALAAVGWAAESWSAAWEASSSGGRLHLPVLAGIRRGRLLARVEVRAASGGSEVELLVEEVEYEVNRPAVVMLALGAGGGLATVFWPLFPKQMAGFMPLALVLLLGAWLLVASRLRSAGAQDFLDTVAEIAEDDLGRETDPQEMDSIQP